MMFPQTVTDGDRGARFRTGAMSALLVLLTCAVTVTATATPKFVVYYNSDATPLQALVGTPYTHVILSFARPALKPNGQLGLKLNKRLAPFWSDVPKLIAAGKKVMISFGGGLAQDEDYKNVAGREKELAALLAQFVNNHGLHGVDIDYEASETFHTERKPGVIDGTQFLIRLTGALRAELPVGEYLISHAPQPPYLDMNWHGGPYLTVLRRVGSDIDFLSLQYYDNPGFDAPAAKVVGITGSFATSYVYLVEGEGGPRIPSSKLLVGKPIYHADANSGHLPPEDVITQIIMPLGRRYGDQFGGLMGWQFSDLTADHRAWNSKVGKELLGEKLSDQSTLSGS